jgi:arginyl-tRNA synthetase
MQMVRLPRGGEREDVGNGRASPPSLRWCTRSAARGAFMMLYRKTTPRSIDLAKVGTRATIRCSTSVRPRALSFGLPHARAVVPTRGRGDGQGSRRPARRSLSDPADLRRCKWRSSRVLEGAASAHEARISFYLYELASEFHALWNKGNDSPHLRFIIQNDPKMTVARLALVEGVVTVLASGLRLLGVDAPEEMR